ncbi:PASTA domain-containing protein [Gynuella sunshinyii]|uniref:PASTA domain-containing protein n=1 Tax=Gynuella sunshinyii YC6258 TaxID=1445510 RepID=A0A0C5VUF4_9GAMM|nr:PASTA domain-containing protein [Gynuella sunshinyii]AJQ97771.1 hypothetical protein YC6258_05743 [Gynuella sunshinyii YC6258]
MKAIQVYARFMNSQDQPVNSLAVSVETFDLQKNAWTELAKSASRSNGVINFRIAFTRNESPVLRLSEAEGEAKVLASACYIYYDNRNQLLSYDFGDIELLEDTAYPLTPTQSRFSNQSITLSGQANRPEVSAAVLMRNLSAINRSGILTTNVGTVAGTVKPTATTAEKAAASLALDVSSIPITVDTYNAELIKFRSIEANLQNTISLKDQDLAAQKTLLENSQKQITQLQKEVTRAQTAEVKLQQQNAIFTDEEKRLAPIDQIASNIGAQIDSANKKLQQETRPYQIQNISLQLKGSISANGQSIALARLTDGEAQLSNAQVMTLDLVKTAQPATTTEVLLPDVSGLTESSVRRLLKSIGLKTESMTKSVGPNSQITLGQAISQSPKAGSKIALNQTVIVVFAIA